MRETTKLKYSTILNRTISTGDSLVNVIEEWNNNHNKIISNGFIDAVRKLDFITADGQLCLPSDINIDAASKIIAERISYQSLVSSVYSKTKQLETRFANANNETGDGAHISYDDFNITITSLKEKIIKCFHKYGIVVKYNGKDDIWVLREPLDKAKHIIPIIDEVLSNTVLIKYQRTKSKVRTPKSNIVNVRSINDIRADILKTKKKLLKLEIELYNKQV